MTAKVYSADEVTIFIGGALIEAGFADGQFLSYEDVSERVQSVAGSNGEVAVSKNLDPRVQFTLTLLQTSDANDLLSGLSQLRRLPGASFIVPYMIRDRNGRTLFEGKCWIKGNPSRTFDRTATARAWEFEGEELFSFDGGNLGA